MMTLHNMRENGVPLFLVRPRGPGSAEKYAAILTPPTVVRAVGMTPRPRP